MQIVANWELSGNGLGQRTEEDKGFGEFTDDHLDCEDGDNRSTYIQIHKGHRFHHLYLWHLSDTMGVLNNVLNILSKEVGADSGNVHIDTARVQRTRKRSNGDDEEEIADRCLFRKTLGVSMAQVAISQKEESIRREEEQAFKYKMMLYDMSDNPGNQSSDRFLFVQRALQKHDDRIKEYTLE